MVDANKTCFSVVTVLAGQVGPSLTPEFRLHGQQIKSIVVTKLNNLVNNFSINLFNLVQFRQREWLNEGQNNYRKFNYLYLFNTKP